MNDEIEQQPHETVGEFEARRLLARMQAKRVAEDRALARLMELPEVGDPALASLVLGVRIAAGAVQTSIDVLNQILRDGR